MCFIGGPGSHIGYYRQFIKTVKREARVTYLGEVTQVELVKKYRDAKSLIHASYFETTGLIGMEALSCGCSLGITDNPYTREYYEGFAQFCDPYSIQSITDCIRTLCSETHKVVSYVPKTKREIGLALEESYLRALDRDEL